MLNFHHSVIVSVSLVLHHFRKMLSFMSAVSVIFQAFMLLFFPAFMFRHFLESVLCSLISGRFRLSLPPFP